MENHEDQPLARSITWELADNLTSIAIIQDDKHVWYSPMTIIIYPLLH
ncbi:hypothetical protein QNN00_13655 [Bacillus velezensis]|nr:hypothetical protein [Bacillus velezensis]